MYDTWVMVRAELISSPVDDHSLFQLRQQNKSPYWWFCRGDQKAVVSACITSVDGSRGKSPEPVRVKPFTTKGGIEVGTDLFSESDHGTLSRARAAITREVDNGKLLSPSSACEIVGEIGRASCRERAWRWERVG